MKKKLISLVLLPADAGAPCAPLQSAEEAAASATANATVDAANTVYKLTAPYCGRAAAL